CYFVPYFFSSASVLYPLSRLFPYTTLFRSLIEVAAEVYGPQLDDGLGHRFGPAHARSFHAVLDEVFAGALHRTTGDGQATCQILVIVHATPVAVEIVRHARQHLALAATERKFGDHLANALDDLADVSF